MAEQHPLNELMEIVEEHYGQRLRRFCSIQVGRKDGEDTYQDALIRIRERGDVLLDKDPTSDDFRRLVYAFAFNECRNNRDYLTRRQMASLYAVSRNGDARIVDELEDESEKGLDYDICEKVQEAVSMLQEQEREILISIVCDKESYKSVGQRLSLTVDTVNNVRRRAIKQMREMLSSWDEDKDSATAQNDSTIDEVQDGAK